jgi:spore coat protein CotF
MTNESELKKDAERNMQMQKMAMNNKKIANMETEIPKTKEMNDRDFLNDMLSTEKYLTTNYNTVMNEVTNQDLYQDLATILKETHDCQRNIFEAMFKNGWYTLEIADQQKMTEAYQQFSNYKNQFPYLH